MCVALGHIYGPQKGKMMHLFVDDLHLPVIQDDGTGLGNVSEVCNTACCLYACMCTINLGYNTVISTRHLGHTWVLSGSVILARFQPCSTYVCIV